MALLVSVLSIGCLGIQLSSVPEDPFLMAYP